VSHNPLAAGDNLLIQPVAVRAFDLDNHGLLHFITGNNTG
jgi:hypothetical protein